MKRIQARGLQPAPGMTQNVEHASHPRPRQNLEALRRRSSSPTASISRWREGEALGIIGPNGAGKTTLFGIMTGTVAPDAGRVLFDGADITRMPPPRRCLMGIARSFQIPQPFGDMTVFENLVVAAAFGGRRRERDAYARCMDILDAMRPRRQGQSPRRQPDAARPQAARARARARDLAARAAARRGRGRPRPSTNVVALVALIKAVRASGVSIIWIEHVVHALLAAIDRLVVLHNGGFIAQGDPQTVIRSPAVADIYLGIAADA